MLLVVTAFLSSLYQDIFSGIDKHEDSAINHWWVAANQRYYPYLITWLYSPCTWGVDAAQLRLAPRSRMA